MNTSPRSIHASLLHLGTISALALAAVPSAFSATSAWDGTTDSVWATGSNWDTTPFAPSSTDTARFNGLGNANTTIDLGAGATIGRLEFNGASTAAYTIGSGGAGAQTLTFTGDYIQSLNVVTNQLINANIVMPDSGVNFTNFSASTSLTLAGDITSSGTLAPIIRFNEDGAGSLIIAGNLSDGAATPNWRFYNSTLTGTFTGSITNEVQIAGGTTLQVGNGGTTGSLGTATRIDTNNAAASLVFNRSDAITVGTRIVGAGTVIQNGTGTTTLTASNNTIANATVNAGTLLISGAALPNDNGGTVTANSGGTFGGAGTTAKAVVVSGSGTLLGGDGTTGTTLTLSGDLTANDGSFLSLALGAGGTHSTLTRTGSGNWNFDSDQAFKFVDLGATTGMYLGLITGLATDPGVSGWTIANGWSGAFTYSGGNVDLNVTAVPEPGTIALVAMGLGFVLLRSRRLFGNRIG